MKRRRFPGVVSLLAFKPPTAVASLAFVAAVLLGSAQSLAQNAYITDYSSNDVSVIDTKTNAVVATIPVGDNPTGVAMAPNGNMGYVANQRSNTVSVIDTKTNTVVATVPVGNNPGGLAITPDGQEVYVSNQLSNTVSVIDTETYTVTTITSPT